MATEATTQATETTQDNKVTFTPEQQARVDEIVREAMGRAGRDNAQKATELTAKVTQLEQDLAAAKAAQKAAVTPDDKKAAKDNVEELQSRIAEMMTVQAQTAAEADRLKRVIADKDKDIERAKSETLNVRKQVAIHEAAANSGFVDVNVVAKLTGDQIKYDEQLGRFVVFGENGQQRLNASYEAMTLQEYYQEFADRNNYLVRSDAKGGTGSSQNQRASTGGKYALEDVFGPKSNGALANKLAKENPAEYRRMRAAAQERGFIA